MGKQAKLQSLGECGRKRRWAFHGAGVLEELISCLILENYEYMYRFLMKLIYFKSRYLQNKLCG